MRLIVTKEELDALPYRSAVLDTCGVLRTKVRIVGIGLDGKPDGKIYGDWKDGTRSAIPSSLLADGRPLLVLWDPSAPAVLVELLVDASMTLRGPNEYPLTLLSDDLPGTQRLREESDAIFKETDWNMQALAAVDFLTCWAKRVRS